MAITMPVRTGQWNEIYDLWVFVHPDPLTSTGWVRVTVHIQGAHLWVDTAGPCGGVRLQTEPPATVGEIHA